MFKSRVTPAIAVTALVVAVLGATPLGQAASRLVLPKNSVGAAQIKKSAVSGKKLANNSVTSAKVKDGSLLGADFKAGQLPAGPKGDTGPRGFQGIQGIQGVKGDPGKDGAPASKLWALVDEVGNISASSGLTTAGPVMVQKGIYVLPFNRDISHCAPVGTIGGVNVLDGDTNGFVKTTLLSTTSVEVETTTPDNVAYAYHAFSLAVFC